MTGRTDRQRGSLQGPTKKKKKKKKRKKKIKRLGGVNGENKAERWWRETPHVHRFPKENKGTGKESRDPAGHRP